MVGRNFISLVAAILATGCCCLGIEENIVDTVGYSSVSSKYFYGDDKEVQAIMEDFDPIEEPLFQTEDSSSSDSKDFSMMEENLSQNVNISHHPGELCNRECLQGDNRICYFQFTMELYQAMGVACGRCRQGVEEDCNHPQCIVGDGFEKGVMSINRQIPGPPIQVCKDDVIIVDVHNIAAGTSASLHWHGIHQRETPFMDGVPFLTQCPIHYGNSFRYQFKATEPGTQFYHSHSGHHKANGHYGVLTVRQPKDMEPLSLLYDHDLPEHHVFISDWMHSYAEMLFPGLPSSVIRPDSVLINGRGVYTHPRTRERTQVRPTIYYVTRGKRYRFRLVNSINHVCPFLMQIENHNFTIIATDSFTVMPRTFDTLISNAGERYDFILKAYQQTGDYWMRVRGLGICDSVSIESYALIRYVDPEFEGDEEYMDTLRNLPVPPFPSYDTTFPAYTVLNHPNATCWDDESDQCVTELTAYEDDDDLRYAEADYKFFVSFDNYEVPNELIFDSGKYFHFQNFKGNITMIAALNNLSLVFPDFPPLTQPERIDERTFCDESNRPAKCEQSEICQCVHRLKVRKDSVVEFIIVDEMRVPTNVNHPFHLHGNRFMVTDIGFNPLGRPMTVKRAMQMESNRLLKKDSSNTSPIFKDTISIPTSGYAIIRLRASNPGFWLLHCHYEWHLSVGMGLVVQVGETSDMVRAPSDFPKCGNYLPMVNAHYN